MVREECAHLGYDIDDPSTWKGRYIRVPTRRRETLEDFAPSPGSACTSWRRRRVKFRAGINLFAMNFVKGPASHTNRLRHSLRMAQRRGHFPALSDSPDQGLLGIPLMTDVFPEGGGTSSPQIP